MQNTPPNSKIVEVKALAFTPEQYEEAEDILLNKVGEKLFKRIQGKTP